MLGSLTEHSGASPTWASNNWTPTSTGGMVSRRPGIVHSTWPTTWAYQIWVVVKM